MFVGTGAEDGSITLELLPSFENVAEDESVEVADVGS
jgi:hypothetical protein